MSSHPTRISVDVRSDDFDLGDEHRRLVDGDRGVGAVTAFVGQVRDLNLADDVVALELEHYPGMTEKSLVRIAEMAADRWPLQAIRIIHRIGKMFPGDNIVLVLTASAHRHAAYESNMFIMDYLKTEAPFWKKEWTPDGPRWIEARTNDASAAMRWSDLPVKATGDH